MNASLEVDQGVGVGRGKESAMEKARRNVYPVVEERNGIPC